MLKPIHLNCWQIIKCCVVLMIGLVAYPSNVLLGAVPTSVQFNKKYGRVRDQFKGSEDKMIVHIQDAHCVYEAQRNIIGLVRDLYKNHNVRLVTVEGADSYFEAGEIASFPIKSAKEDVADYFMQKGRISGIEYLLIEKDLPLAVRGAENRDLYLENYNIFLKTLPGQNDALANVLKELKNGLENLKTFMLSDSLREIDSFVVSYNVGQVQFADYAVYLLEKISEKGISLEGYENFQVLSKARQMESSIDFAKINVELSGIIDILSEKIDRDVLTDLLNKNLFYKIGKIQPNVFFAFLKQVCDENKCDLTEYPDLQKYISYLELYDSIDDVAIVNESDMLLEKIESALYENASQKKLIELSSDFLILEKLLTLKASKKQLNYFRTNKEKFSETLFVDYLKEYAPVYQIAVNLNLNFDIISQRIQMADEFYDSAVKRNAALIENTIAEMDLEDTNVAILITGGFHTEGITEILKERGISYTVLSPIISEQPENTHYLSRLVGAPTEIEELFAANRLQIPLVLADPAIVEQVGRRQFIDAFKALLETHESSAMLGEALERQGERAEYTPLITFTDAFTLNGNNYLAFSFAGQKFYMVRGADGESLTEQFQPAQATVLRRAVQKIGNREFAFIDESTFLQKAQNSERRIIASQSGLDIYLESALATGDMKQLERIGSKDAMLLDTYLRKNFIVSDEDQLKPTLSYLLNSRASALVIQPKVGFANVFEPKTRDIFLNNSITRVEVFSNVTDISDADAAFLNNNIGGLIKNGALNLPSGQQVRAVVVDGTLRVFSVMTQGELSLRPQLVVDDDVLRALYPDYKPVALTSVAEALRQGTDIGYIDIDASGLTVSLYATDASGKRTLIDSVPINLESASKQITSTTIFDAIIALRQKANESNIALVGYGNPANGIAISFDSLDSLIANVQNNDLVRAYQSIFRFLSVAPSMKDITPAVLADEGITNAQGLADYFLRFFPETERQALEPVVTCICAAAADFHVKSDLQIGQGVFAKLTPEQKRLIFTRLIPLIDLRMKGALPSMHDGKPLYSLYSVAQAYKIFGLNSQPLFVPQAQLRGLLEALPSGETAIIRLVIDGAGHVISVEKTADQKFLVTDLIYESYLQDKGEKGRQKLLNIDTLLRLYAPSFSGQALVAQSQLATTSILDSFLASNDDVYALGIDDQLQAVAAMGTVVNIGNYIVNSSTRFSQEVRANVLDALSPVNAEASDVDRLLGEGPVSITADNQFVLQPQRLTEVLTVIQGEDPASAPNVLTGALYNLTLLESLKRIAETDDDDDILQYVLENLDVEISDSLYNAMREYYYYPTQVPDKKLVLEEFIAKFYTQRIFPDESSQFFQRSDVGRFTNAVEMALRNTDRGRMFVDAVGFEAPENQVDALLQLIKNIKALGIDVSHIEQAVTDPNNINVISDARRDAYIRNLLNYNLVLALKNIVPQGELRFTADEEAIIQQKIKEDIDFARRRSLAVEQVPSITAMNFDFFKTDAVNDILSQPNVIASWDLEQLRRIITERGGVANSRTFNIKNQIEEFGANPNNKFAIYSLEVPSNVIEKILALHGIGLDKVLVVGSDTFQSAIPAEGYEAGKADNFLSLPVILQNMLELKTELDLRDFTIIEENSAIAAIALSNKAIVIDMPEGLNPDDLQNAEGNLLRDQIEAGVSALDLAQMLGPDQKELPRDLIVTDVSGNPLIQRIYQDILQQKRAKNEPEEVTFGELVDKSPLKKFNTEDLRGLKVIRKIKVDQSFVDKLKAQRALDISA
ncbi:hypothetical protein KDK77_01570 [bacterium]|nr:hypothetical protein [bacterium]